MVAHIEPVLTFATPSLGSFCKVVVGPPGAPQGLPVLVIHHSVLLPDIVQSLD